MLTKPALSVDGIEMTLATNHLGPFLLNNLLVDLLTRNAPARIINVSSAIHRWGKLDLEDLQFKKRKYHFMKAYAQSKLLMNTVTFELAHKLEGTGITVNCLHPGAVKTNLGSDNASNAFLKFADKIIREKSPQQALRYFAHTQKPFYFYAFSNLDIPNALGLEVFNNLKGKRAIHRYRRGSIAASPAEPDDTEKPEDPPPP